MKNMIRILFIASFILCQFVSAFAQDTKISFLEDTKGGFRERTVDMEKMRLELEFEPEIGLVKGSVSFKFRTLRRKVDTLFFDGPGIKVRDAYLNGKHINVIHRPEGITVVPPTPFLAGSVDSITFDYTATPAKGLYFIGWEKGNVNSRKQIWSQGQGIDNRHWFPCFDDMNDKLLTELVVTFDSTYKVLSNGKKLIEKDNKDGTYTWTYIMSNPHSPYLVMLAIGKYAIKTSKTNRGVQVNNYYYPEFPRKVEPTFIYTERIIDFMEKSTGLNYPWDQYSQIPVQDYLHGAMENTTATIFGDFYLVDERAFLDKNYIGVNAHEITHQWFGNYLTARSAKHAWLQESFATYYAKRFIKEVFGEDYYQWEKRGEQNNAISASSKNRYPVIHSKGGSARLYSKGSFVLDMLRTVVGDEDFKRTITFFLKKYPYGLVDSNDFLNAFKDCLGMDLDWFFQQWLYRDGEPHYKVSYEQALLNDSPVVLITVKQIQKKDELSGLFRMPIDLEVHFKDGTFEAVTQWIENEEQVIKISNRNRKAIDYVLFDPGNKILKNLTFEKSEEELYAQAMKAKNLLDRYDAVLALRQIYIEDKRVPLIGIFDKERFYAVKAEIVSQLINDQDPRSRQMLVRALKDDEPKVRLSVVKNTTQLDDVLKPALMKNLNDPSYEVLAGAMEKLCTLDRNNISTYLDLAENTSGQNKNVEIKRLEMGSMIERFRYLPQLIDYSSPGYEFRTRINAIEALSRLNYLDEVVALNLLEAATHFNFRLAGVANIALENYMKQTVNKAIIRDALQKSKLSEKRLDKLSAQIKAG